MATESTEYPKLEEYIGGCHCGFYTYTIRVPEVKQIRSCNCSICVRKAYSWIYPIDDNNVIVPKGSASLEQLSMYEYGEKTMKHYFCPKCGSALLAFRSKNVRGVDGKWGATVRTLSAPPLNIETSVFPGAELPPLYQPPSFPDIPTERLKAIEEAGQTVYRGNCHCEAVTFSVISKPLGDRATEVVSCSCIFCSKTGALFLSTSENEAPDYTLHTGFDSIIRYGTYSFCLACGVVVFGHGPKDEGVVTLSEERLGMVNVRCLNEVDITGLKTVNKSL